MTTTAASPWKGWLLGSSPEIEVLQRAVRAALLQQPDAELAKRTATRLDWDRLVDIARLNKVSVFLLKGLEISDAPAPASARGKLQVYQRATMLMNSRNLSTIRRIATTLGEHGLPLVVYKGPVHQRSLYGNYFQKPAGDVDILVRQEDYARATELIISEGYDLAKECESPWWKLFLGEQHFKARGGDLLTVDLHHRTQQPGCPAPYDPDRFLASREQVTVGGVTVTTLSRTNAFLLACMSLAKGMFHQEAVAGYACDVAAVLADSSPQAAARLLQEAHSQRLLNTVLLAIRTVRILFGIETEIPPQFQHVVCGRTSDRDLRGMALTPELDEVRWPKRREMLWELCDTKWTYPREATWTVSGEIFRRFFDARAGLNTPGSSQITADAA